MSPKWHLAYFVPIDGHCGQIGRYGLQFFCCPALTFTLIFKPILAIIVIFWSIFEDRMANLGLIDFKIGLYINVNVNTSRANFGIWPPNFFEDLNQKSASILKRF